MTLVTGTVQDIGYDGMEGTLWARPARFRSDGSVVYAPERTPYKVVDGVVSADLAPGPAVLELQVGSHARDTFEVVIPEVDTTLADLLDAVFPWEPEQVSRFVAEREAAQEAAADAETAAATATTAAQQTGQDRTAVASDKDTVVSHVQALAEPNDAAVLGLISEGADTATKAALNATYEQAGVAVQVAETAYDVHRSGAVGDGVTDDLPAIAHAMQTVGPGGVIRLRPGHTYAANGTLPPFEGTVDARGARLLASAGMPGNTSMIRQSGKLPLNWIGGTIDGNKDNRPAPTQTTAVAVYIVEENDTLGWDEPTVFSDVTFVNHLAIPFRAQGHPINMIDTTSGPFDAINAPYAPVHVIRPRVVGGFYGISARLMRGWVCESPQVSDTARNGVEDRQTAYARWVGGTVTNAGIGTSGIGHGWVSSYSAHPLFEGCQALNCADYGFVSGGGHANYVPGYGLTWSNTVAYGSGGHGYSVDTTISGDPANQRVDGKIIGAQAINSGQSGANGMHGVYLQKAARMTISDLTSRGAALGAGLLINGKHAAVSSSFLTENQIGVNLVGDTPGANGYHGIGRDVVATGNGTDWSVSSHGGEGTVLDLQGTRLVAGQPTPEGGVIAPVGSTYRDINSGEMWVKTAWVPGDTTTYRTGWKKITTAV